MKSGRSTAEKGTLANTMQTQNHLDGLLRYYVIKILRIVVLPIRLNPLPISDHPPLIYIQLIQIMKTFSATAEGKGRNNSNSVFLSDVINRNRWAIRRRRERRN